MAATPEKLFQAHVKNVKAISVAFKRLCLELNECLARGDEKTADALLKTAMLLLGAWAENRLRKVLFEPNGFTRADRNLVEESSTQIDCWNKAIELGFRRRFGIRCADLDTALDATPRFRYCSLLGVVKSELSPIIKVRNKLAHGQWARALNYSNDDFSPDTMAQIRGENAHSMKCKRRMLESLALLLHDLVAGNHAFSRDFDKHFRNLEHAKREISTRSYSDWLDDMRAKYSRGQAKRRQSGSN